MYRRKTMSLLVTILVLFTQLFSYISACTAIIVGKRLTTDGSFIFGRNEDFVTAPDWNKNFKVHEKGKHKKGETFKDGANGFTYIFSKDSFKYISIPDVTPEEGIFDEAGFNEYGVMMDATVSASANDEIQKVDPYVKDGLAESAITTIILPYVKTAREGVNLLADIIKNKGASEGNSLVIADKNEVWFIEIYSGHEFAAIKYPDDKFSVIPNTYFLGTVDLNDKENVIASPNIVKVAKKAGTYVEENGKIHLAKSYAPKFEDNDRSRSYSGILSLNPNAKIKYSDERYDFLQSSDKKISLQDVMKTFRNRLENTNFKPAPRDQVKKNIKENKIDPVYKYSIGNENTVESHIFQIKDNLPQNVGGVVWLAMGGTKFVPYVPYYGNITSTYKAYHNTNTKYDSESLYWVANEVNNMMFNSSKKLQDDFLEKISRYESDKISEQSKLDEKISKMSVLEAQKFATELSLKNGKEIFEIEKNQENLLKSFK